MDGVQSCGDATAVPSTTCSRVHCVTQRQCIVEGNKASAVAATMRRPVITDRIARVRSQLPALHLGLFNG